MPDPLILHPADTVAVLTERAPAGSDPLGLGTPLAKPVAAGHKIARSAMTAGQAVLKFGQIIGTATQNIAAGDHVHVQNLDAARAAATE